MEEKERIELYRKVLETWGVPNQVMMVMEETGEMLNALGKRHRNRATPMEIITELADVVILMEQMAVLYGWETYKAEKERKLERLKKKLEEGLELIEGNQRRE